METLPLQSVFKDFEKFIQSFKTVILGTLSATVEAEASYAPVLQKNGKFYIYVSELAKHTHNLLENKQLTLLFIQDEQDADNIFARKRATLKSEARHLARDAEGWSELMDAYGEHLGETAKNLRNLQDFHLFELTPIKATFVRGFAQAYHLDGEQLNQVRHMNDRGHGQSKLTEDKKAS
ncbi:pyridoxamine 5'-phosphate oxidase family protein [Thiomicrospira microaerophila]|uniref:HugZ family pyridoxamine 5'-phosphate oxidase n=1 Tax=Thiomicrospira microaerophila TaxID=406020 RepID=UPI00200D3C59|nr:pyridoxamine 5'-phosphate oxidase family protein [Thiomicrospira microaerophila]UQB42188.1 pyridoxamine 5'-phosphate oxidase family protein [Thiomicrospira microaerophila]